VRPLALLVATLSPLLILGWLLATPDVNQPAVNSVEHFVITTNVSFITLLVAVLTARAALQIRHYPTLLIAIGFMTMAGIFAVHGLSTPGVLQRGDKEDDAGLVVGVSGQLALLIPAIFFAIRYTPLVAWLDRTVRPRVLLGGVLAALGVYAFVAIAFPAWLGGIARVMLVSAGAYYDYDPQTFGYGGYRAPDLLGGAGWLPYILVTGVVLLFGFVALRLGGWARLGAVALGVGSLLAITGMDRLELTTRDNPTVFLPLSLAGLALNGLGWVVLGLWFVSRPRSAATSS